MSPVANSVMLESPANNLSLRDTLKKMVSHLDKHHGGDEGTGRSAAPLDILETRKDYTFFLDVPGLSKSDVQVTLEEERVLVVKGGGKRKREEVEEEGCRYLRLERKALTKFERKFRLPEDANPSAISAKCENGVLSIVVEKLPPPETKVKTVQVTKLPPPETKVKTVQVKID